MTRWRESLLLASLLVACSGSKPSESDGRQILVNKVPPNCMELVSFRKTDGQDAESMGVKVYRINYEARLKFTATCYWWGGLDAANQAEFNRRAPAFAMLFGEQNFSRPAVSDKVAPPGKEVDIKGMLCWQKSENGWREMNC